MADSVGSGFPRSGIQVGHLFYDLDDGITYQYVGGSPSDSNNWPAVFGNTAYAQLSNVATVVPGDTNPLIITFQVEEIRGMSVRSSTDITIQESGVYSIVSGAQCDKTGGGGTAHFLDMWLQKNGIDLPNTGVRNTIIQLAETKVLIVNWVGELLVGDVVTEFVAVNNAGVGLGLYTLTNTVGAVIPANILTIMKIA